MKTTVVMFRHDYLNDDNDDDNMMKGKAKIRFRSQKERKKYMKIKISTRFCFERQVSGIVGRADILTTLLFLVSFISHDRYVLVLFVGILGIIIQSRD